MKQQLKFSVYFIGADYAGGYASGDHQVFAQFGPFDFAIDLLGTPELTWTKFHFSTDALNTNAAELRLSFYNTKGFS